MGLKEDYRLKKLKKEMHRLHCEITKCCDGEGGDGLTCEDLENCPEIIEIKNSIPEDISDLSDNSNLLFDGDYDSLSNKPTLPVVNDGQLELNTSGIATGGTQSFSANQYGNTSFTVDVPGTDITLSFNNNILTVSSTTGQSDSIDLSSLVTADTYVVSMSLSGNTLILTNNDSTTVQQDLSSILFDGDYNNLSNKPTIPTNNSELVNDSNYLTCEDLETCQEIIDIKDSIPTDVSDLTDTSGILLEYKGEHSSAPSSPQKGWFYKNTDDGVMYYFDGTNWIAYAEGGGGGGGIIFIERSLPDLHVDIANNELVPGATYKITGVHKAHTVNGTPVPALYDDGRDLGTTIFLKAVSENKLENSGSGIFYNPKYDLNIPGYGIWTSKVTVSLSNISGTFDLESRETVTANNGAIGEILTNGWIEYISGDWVNATSITGDDSGATADIDSVSVPSYNANDVVFWGGYAWKNLNGNVGSSVDVLNLDAEWEKIPYESQNTQTGTNCIADYETYRQDQLDNWQAIIDNNADIDMQNPPANLLELLQNSVDYSVTFVTDYKQFLIDTKAHIEDCACLVNYGDWDLQANGMNMATSINSQIQSQLPTLQNLYPQFVADNQAKIDLIDTTTVEIEGLIPLIKYVEIQNCIGFYNEKIDFIEYDIENDFITRRRNEEYNIDVNQTFELFIFHRFEYSSISVMNYGLGYSNGNPRSGIMNAKINNSYVELVNFRGMCINVNFDNNSYFYNVNFDNYSNFQHVNFYNNSYFYNVNFDNGSSFSNVNFYNNSIFSDVNLDNGSRFQNVNFDDGSRFNYVNFDDSRFQDVNFDNGSRFQNVNFDNGSNFQNVNFDNGSRFNYVNFDDSYFYNVNFDNGSRFQNVNFDNGSNFTNINFDNNSYFQSVNFDNGSNFQDVNFYNNSYFQDVNFYNNSYFQNVNFDNNSYFQSVNFDNGSNFQDVNFDVFRIAYSIPTLLLDNKSIRNTDFKGVPGYLLLPDLSSATVIFDFTIRKEIIQILGATNNCKLITYDTNGDRVVNDIDD